MTIRPATEADHETVMALQAKYPDRMALNPYENVNGPVFVAEEGGKVIGVTVFRRTVEAFLAMEPSLSDFKKAKVSLQMAQAVREPIRDLGYGEYHAYTHDPKYARLLNELPGAHEDKRLHAWVNLVEEKK